MSTNTFSDTPAIGATGVTSVINTGDLLTYLTGDAYFNETGDFGRVNMYYNHTGGRQKKRVIHEIGSTGALEGTLEFSSHAITGSWEKSSIKVVGTDGAEHDLERAVSGITGEDLTLS